jgi:hypothetical protein
VKLSYDQWTNVVGSKDKEGFAVILRNMGNIGFTYGGGCFFGHGVYVDKATGSAKFCTDRA